MLNTYAYNRKTKEEDDAILAAVKRHHNAVAAKGYLVVFTALIGSQNYDLDDEYSDIDTVSFIFPPLGSLAAAEEPQAFCIEMDDGHAEVKDIRVALNLLKKASPNSIEYFVSKYKYYNLLFAPELKEYLDDNTKMWNMVHCNYRHMLYAMSGMARQLTKRNMPAGKKYAHALRLMDMHYHFFNSYNAGAVIELRMGGDRDLALAAKRDTDEEKVLTYEEECEQIAGWLENYRLGFEITDEQLKIEEFGQALINSFQWKLFRKYIMETNK